MSTPQIHTVTMRNIIPTKDDFESLLAAKVSYEAKQNTPERDSWNKRHFNDTPWGIAYNVSAGKYNKSVAAYNKTEKKGKEPQPKYEAALRYFIAAVAIDWKELVDQLKRALKNWGYTSEDLKDLAKQTWQDSIILKDIGQALEDAQINGITLIESVEKHTTLNSKLFTKEESLKDKVRDKMLEIVDEFLDNLKEQDIEIKVDDILFIGSNASYNYTKDSDIDLHILTNTKATKYSAEVANALYSAYRSLFNKSLDIEFFGIPLEVFIETEDSKRVSNGIYSVKKNKWIKKPVQEEIPDYDTKALDELVNAWEAKCKKLIDDIKADKLDEEKKVVEMLEDIYEKLRKKGISKGEYSIENLAFKELRNKGYLDQLKDYKNELISKRLSLEEQLNKKQREELLYQLSKAANGHPPIIQDNGMFYIYNIKESEISRVFSAVRRLPFVSDVTMRDNGKYDFSQVGMTNLPTKYYDIKGIIKL